MSAFAVTETPSLTLSDGSQVFLEVPCTFKVARFLSALSAAATQLNLSALLADAATVNATVLAARILPSLLTAAPDLFLGVLALFLIPNAELEALAKQPGGVDSAIADKSAWLSFHTTAGDALALANALLPLLGVDALKNALSRLVETASSALGLNPPATPA